MKVKTKLIITAAILAVATIALVLLYTLVPMPKSNVAEFINAQESPEYIKDSTQALEIYNTKNMHLTAETRAATSDTADIVVELTATITPVTAADKSVDWSVEFVYPDNVWSKGKDAANYVAVEPLEDGSATAVVYAKARFMERAKIIATSRVNPNATAYCIVDYGSRLTDNATIVFDHTDIVSDLEMTVDTYVNDIEIIEPIPVGNFDDVLHIYESTFTYTPKYSGGTKSTSGHSIKIELKPGQEFYDLLKAKGLGKDTNDWTIVENGGAVSNIYNALCKTAVVPTSDSQECFDRVNLFHTAILETADAEYDFEIKISVVADFNSKEYTIRCKFNRDNAVFAASGVEIDNSNIVI